MKKYSITAIVFLFITAFVLQAQAVMAAGVSVLVNGEGVTYDQAPIIENNRTLIPLRGTFEKAGATVDWNQKQRLITVKSQNNEIKVTIGSRTAYINGKATQLDVPAQIKNNRTLVPLRFIGEGLSGKVDWNNSTKTVRIQFTPPNPSATTPPITNEPSNPNPSPVEPPVTNNPTQPAPTPGGSDVTNPKEDVKTVNQIVTNYQTQLTALETKGNNLITNLAKEAKDELNAKLRSGETFSITELYNKYSKRANTLEGQIDSEFNQIYSSLQSDLVQNGHSKDAASHILTDYEAKKIQRQNEVLSTILG